MNRSRGIFQPNRAAEQWKIPPDLLGLGLGLGLGAPLNDLSESRLCRLLC